MGRLLLIPLIGCVGSGTEEPTVTQPEDVSFRILTWNIAFVADGKDVNNGTWEDDAARAAFVAQKLVDEQSSHNADVIVINEAFNIEPQDELSAKLCGTYPSFVRFLDGDDPTAEQDSGLMLFSKHPFQPLGLSSQDHYAPDWLAFTGCVDEDADDDDPLFWSEVGFTVFPYEDCSSYDCWADKGIAAVRVGRGATVEPINLLFTHLQSSDEYWEDRVEQMKQVEELVTSIPGWQEQRTFLVGDLNINGSGCSGSGCTVPDVGTEWTTHFGSGGFFGCGAATCGEGGAHFIDSWGFEMPPEDLGRTYTSLEGTIFLDDTLGRRLDYILHNVPSERLSCLQHMRVLRDWSDANGTQASDHLPVWAEFNYKAPHCNPLDAQAVTAQPDFHADGTITYPQSVQWYRIDNAGTFSISTSSEVFFEVYAADDMSYPVGDYNGETSRWGTIYKLPEPPYYVKVEAEQALFTGAYDLDIHEHACGPHDCCALTPGDTVGADTDWSSGDLSAGERWFCFYTDVGEGGDYPQITFEQEASCTERLDMALWSADDQLEPDQELPWNSYDWCDGLNCAEGQVENDATAAVTRLEPGKYFVQVAQDPFDPYGSCEARLRFFTTLTYFSPKTLICHDETGANGTLEEVGNDEIWSYLTVDGPCEASTDLTMYTKLGDFEEDDSRSEGLTSFGERLYTGCVVMNLLEEDDISDGDVEFLGPQNVITTLDLEQTDGIFQQVWNIDDDYLYQMKYILSHEPR